MTDTPDEVDPVDVAQDDADDVDVDELVGEPVEAPVELTVDPRTFEEEDNVDADALDEGGDDEEEVADGDEELLDTSDVDDDEEADA